jgi:hypothetical protein
MAEDHDRYQDIGAIRDALAKLPAQTRANIAGEVLKNFPEEATDTKSLFGKGEG